MYSVSDEFLKLMSSNIRPKTEPTITVKGEDVEGNVVSLTWKPRNIKDMTYKRGIDPVGRSLPYMELTWTEIYYGKLTEENYPEKYNNIVKYMSVELSFKQQIGIFNTWKSILDAGETWQSLFEKYNTWKRVKNNPNPPNIAYEKVTFPTMFLVAKPTISGQTITWTARDLFYFLNENASKNFITGINYRNPIRWLLLNERGNFLNSDEIFRALSKSQLEADTTKDGNLDEPIIFDNTTKNLLMNYASIRNYYWDFKDNYILLKNFTDLTEPTNSVFRFTGRIIKQYPQLTQNLDISAYSFKRYVAETDEDNAYILSPSGIIDYQGEKFYKFLFKGFGKVLAGSVVPSNTISKDAIVENDKITVVPVNFNYYEEIIHTKKQGEIFVEDNPLNPYSSSNSFIVDRFNLLNKWFSSQQYSMETNGLPNVAVETGDLAEVETNLFKNGKRVIKNAIVVGLELHYNGALTQKTLFHEVII